MSGPRWPQPPPHSRPPNPVPPPRSQTAALPAPTAGSSPPAAPASALPPVSPPPPSRRNPSRRSSPLPAAEQRHLVLRRKRGPPHNPPPRASGKADSGGSMTRHQTGPSAPNTPSTDCRPSQGTPPHPPGSPPPPRRVIDPVQRSSGRAVHPGAPAADRASRAAHRPARPRRDPFRKGMRGIHYRPDPLRAQRRQKPLLPPNPPTRVGTPWGKGRRTARQARPEPEPAPARRIPRLCRAGSTATLIPRARSPRPPGRRSPRHRRSLAHRLPHPCQRPLRHRPCQRLSDHAIGVQHRPFAVATRPSHHHVASASNLPATA